LTSLGSILNEGIGRMKIKGYRFPCEVCNNSVDCSVQVFFRRNGEVSYARARHYGADKKFSYHQQSVEYVNRKLRELSIDLPIDPSQVSNNKSFGQTNLELGSKSRIMAGGEGFEPSTPNLGGWCSIRTELLAQLFLKMVLDSASSRSTFVF
jgi:hypothetical protein